MMNTNINSRIKSTTFLNLPAELIGEVCKYLQPKEYHSWMLLSKQVFERLSSDACYASYYWKEINYHCNIQKKEIYVPETWTYEGNVHPLFAKYGKIDKNFRRALIEFRKEFCQRKHFEYYPVEKLYQVNSTTQNIGAYFQRAKCVFVGEGYAGKSSLIWRLYDGRFLEYQYWCDYPSVTYKNIDFSLWDTAGQSDYDRLRCLSYPDTDLIFLCFSIVGRVQFESIQKKWIFELRHNLRDCPIILVGCKQDLRESSETFVTTEEAEQLAKYLGCVTYWECSSKTGFGTEHAEGIILNSFAFANQITKKKICFLQ